VACALDAAGGFKAPLHFTTCSRAPTLVGEFSLATENCLPFVDKNFKDYGQCSHIAERASSGWWKRHTKSFAMRQIDTYERELGWAFWSWKLDDVSESYDPSAVYWSFRLAHSQGLINLDEATAGSDIGGACAHKPDSDFFMGDLTYSPTQEPTIYYWIPPAPTPAPTPFGTIAVVPSLQSGISASLLGFAGLLLVYWALKACVCSRRSANGYSAIASQQINAETELTTPAIAGGV
jgi:hypothetical protein